MVTHNRSTSGNAGVADAWFYCCECVNTVVRQETPVIHIVIYLGILILKVVPCPGLLLT